MFRNSHSDERQSLSQGYLLCYEVHMAVLTWEAQRSCQCYCKIGLSNEALPQPSGTGHALESWCFIVKQPSCIRLKFLIPFPCFRKTTWHLWQLFTSLAVPHVQVISTCLHMYAQGSISILRLSLLLLLLLPQRSLKLSALCKDLYMQAFELHKVLTGRSMPDVVLLSNTWRIHAGDVKEVWSARISTANTVIFPVKRQEWPDWWFVYASSTVQWTLPRAFFKPLSHMLVFAESLELTYRWQELQSIFQFLYWSRFERTHTSRCKRLR